MRLRRLRERFAIALWPDVKPPKTSFPYLTIRDLTAELRAAETNIRWATNKARQWDNEAQLWKSRFASLRDRYEFLRQGMCGAADEHERLEASTE